MKYLLAFTALFASLSFAQTTYYSDSNGMPMGTAQRSGNTTYYSNANGMPVGTAQSTQPIQPFQQAPMNTPSAPTFPTSPLFPSSPRGM
jgi:hypothetical protein